MCAVQTGLIEKRKIYCSNMYNVDEVRWILKLEPCICGCSRTPASSMCTYIYIRYWMAKNGTSIYIFRVFLFTPTALLTVLYYMAWPSDVYIFVHDLYIYITNVRCRDGNGIGAAIGGFIQWIYNNCIWIYIEYFMRIKY